MFMLPLPEDMTNASGSGWPTRTGLLKSVHELNQKKNYKAFTSLIAANHTAQYYLISSSASGTSLECK